MEIAEVVRLILDGYSIDEAIDNLLEFSTTGKKASSSIQNITHAVGRLKTIKNASARKTTVFGKKKFLKSWGLADSLQKLHKVYTHF